MARKTKRPAPRQCQPCTACCDGWVQITVNDYEAWPGHPCPHSTGQGCDDYDNRPEHPCRRFVCGWIVPDSPLPDWMKPNEARVMVLFNKRQWRGLPVDVALPVGRRIPPRALNWLKQFAERHGRPLLYTEQILDEHGNFSREQQVVAWGPPEFQREALQWKARGISLWDD